MAQDLIDMLVDAGFERVSVVEKEESKEFIKDWLPGSGAEDYVVSANVTAYKALYERYGRRVERRGPLRG